MSDSDIVWFEYELSFNKNNGRQGNSRQFVLNKTCPKCGSKVYWIDYTGKCICKTCKDKKTKP